MAMSDIPPGRAASVDVGDDDVRRFERLFRVAERIAPEAWDAIEQARSTLLGMRGRSIGSALVLDQRTCPV